MGTYDTRGGSPISPPDNEPFIFPEENELLGVLEDADVATETNDKVWAILRRVLEREAIAAQGHAPGVARHAGGVREISPEALVRRALMNARPRDPGEAPEMNELRHDGTPYPTDEDSDYGRWLKAYLARIGWIHDGMFDCSNLKAAYQAGEAEGHAYAMELRELLERAQLYSHGKYWPQGLFDAVDAALDKNPNGSTPTTASTGRDSKSPASATNASPLTSACHRVVQPRKETK